jgi:hypothetical protein
MRESPVENEKEWCECSWRQIRSREYASVRRACKAERIDDAQSADFG